MNGFVLIVFGLVAIASPGCRMTLPWRPPGELIVELPEAAHGTPASVLYLERDSSSGPRTRWWRSDVMDVSSEGTSFRPGLTAVRVGDAVRFVNRGNVAHRLFTSEDGGRVERFVAPLGGSDPLRLARAGEHRFYCSLHPDEGFVVFAPTTGLFAVSTGERSVRIREIPPGSYRLNWWSHAGSRDVGSVEIRSGVVAAHAIPISSIRAPAR